MIGKRIKLARDAAGIGQVVLANAIGVAQPTVSGWETGASDPTVENLVATALCLQVSFEWLATGRGEMAYVPIHGVGQTVAKYDVVTRTDDQHLLLQLYSKLKPSQRQALLTLLKNW